MTVNEITGTKTDLEEVFVRTSDLKNKAFFRRRNY